MLVMKQVFSNLLKNKLMFTSAEQEILIYFLSTKAIIRAAHQLNTCECLVVQCNKLFSISLQKGLASHDKSSLSCY